MMPAFAQTSASCQVVNGTYTCTGQNTSSTTGLAVAAPAYNSSTAYNISLNVAAPTFGSNTGLITYVDGYTGSAGGPGNYFGLNVTATGPNTSSNGGNTSGLSITNDSQLSFTPVGAAPYDNGYLLGIYGAQTGGIGATSGKDLASGGSVQGPTTINNTGLILSALPGYQTYGSYGIVGLSTGADAIVGDSPGGFTTGGPVSIVNQGVIAATSNNAAIISGDLAAASPASIITGAAGIAAVATGGEGHWDQGGGSAGSASVTDSALVFGNFYGQGGSTDLQNGFYGILAQSKGGLGGVDDQNSNAGNGGDAGAASVTLTSGADVYYYLDDGNTVATPAGSPDAGVSAASIGGTGGYAYNGNNDSGGNAGSAGTATVAITDANVETVASKNGSLPAVIAFSAGGAGGCAGSPSSGDPTNACTSNSNNPSENGGSGGAAGDASVNIIAQTMPVTISAQTANGNDSPAVEIYSVGGTGGVGGYSYDTGASTAHGGYGGQGGDSRYISSVLSAAQPLTISASGADSPGVYALSAGGAGGLAAAAHIHTTGSADGGNGGAGGDALGTGSSAVTLAGSAQGRISLSTNGNDSPGVYASSMGGTGGAGGEATSGSDSSVYGGNGGNGGSAGDLSVNLEYSALTTQQASSPGIAAVAAGGAGGAGGDISAQVVSGGTAGNGASGGGTADVSVTTDGNSSITTSGTDSMGIVAETLSGGGGAAGSATDSNGGTVAAYAGSSGNGGDAGNVSVTNAADITTAGATARGILAQSLPGAGGTGGNGWGVFVGDGSSGGTGGVAGNVTVTNSGDIVTGYGDSTVTGGDTTAAQSNAEGVLVQSIGGLGGAGGQGGGVIANLGGQGGTGSTGGSATFNENGGSVITSGYGGDGALVQSIGGDGGDGGGAQGGFVALGGNGGNAANAGAVNGNLAQGAQITTQNDESDGVVLQSIGGGGGNAGNASAKGVFASVGIGGTGAGGGNGGVVFGEIFNSAITTQGTESSGLVVQSVGGGGGTGGDAESFAGGPGFSAGLAFGGSGGGGGDGSYATANLTGSTIATGQDPWLIAGSSSGACPDAPSTNGGCNTLPADDYGVVVQSIGGGGGVGGSATAKAFTIAENDDEDAIPYPNVAFAGAFGASGGSGGAGGQAQVNLSNNAAIITAGQGSDGVLAQSIGGGGGAGGDSSAMATVKDYAGKVGLPTNAIGVNLTFGMDGGGGAGDSAGTVEVLLGGIWDSPRNQTTQINQFTLDPAGDAGTGIATYGDYADGINAQSIGGGGGDAGYGAGNTQGSGTTYTASASVVLGASGGTGANGGLVVVGLYAPAGDTQVTTGSSAVPVIPEGITTYGSGAIGLLAQSVGGGGGSSQGDSINASGSFSVKGATLTPTLKLGFGGNGVTGGQGGAVNVVVQAPITTHGGDAEGVLAQSVGGGGGLGGSAGSDGSGDNPVNETTDGREFSVNTGNLLETTLKELAKDSFSLTPTFDFSMGGTGGSGNTGGTVSVNIDSAITTGAPIDVGGVMQTNGDWADGVIAQSIGGGGGKGGTAMATGTGGISAFTLNLNFALGGAGGSGGAGGAANVLLGETNAEYQATGNYGSFSVATSGFGAAGVVAQSIGGGGGIGSDGSDEATGAISVGGSYSGSDGSGGDGGTAEVQTQNEVSSSIATTGANADGVIVQSVGGGGGIGGAGSTAWVTNQAVWVPQDAQYAQANNAPTTLSLSLGGNGSAGAGGAATFDSSEGPVNISTSGDGSFGILVQSIGGGGGLISATPTGTMVQKANLGGTAGGDSNDLSGGPVTVNIGQATNNGPDSPTNIVTTGDTAYGVVAQSIGSGGGVMRLAGETLGAEPVLRTDDASCCTTETSPGAGSGGDVTVNMSVKSSIDVSGPGSIGIFAQSAGGGGGLIINGSVYAGSVLGDGYSGGGAGNVTVNQNGSITAEGYNAVGIFAQVAGNQNQMGTISITTDGTITVKGPTNTSLGGGTDIQVDSPNLANVTVASGSTLTNVTQDANAIAVDNTGSGTVNVNIDGTVYGEINNGSVNIGTGNYFPSAIGGTPGQTGGVWNAAGYTSGIVKNAGTLNVYNSLELGSDYTQTQTGNLGIVVDSLNHAASHLQVDGSADIAGLIIPSAVSLLPGAIPIVTAQSLDFSGKALGSLLFDWNAIRHGNTLSLNPAAKFNASGVALTGSEYSAAEYFQKAWANADAVFALQFAGFSQISDAGRYTATLDAYSGKAAEAQSLALINMMGSILGSAMSCPEFGGASVLITENSCVWAKVTTQQDSQWGTGDIQGYHVTDATYRMGGQRQLSPGWYLGGSIAGGQDWATTNGTENDHSSGYGQNYDGSVALKHIVGPWLFAGSISVAGGSYHSNRVISLPGTQAVLGSSPAAFLAGVRLRAGYEFGFQNWYVRPYSDVDLRYSNLPGFTENGLAQYALHVKGTQTLNVAFSPMMELGGRFNAGPQIIVHPFAAAGGSFVPGNRMDVDARIVGASAADGSFRNYLQLPGAVANLQAGIQLYQGAHIDLTAEYNAMLGGSYLGQSEMAKFAWHF